MIRRYSSRSGCRAFAWTWAGTCVILALSGCSLTLAGDGIPTIQKRRDTASPRESVFTTTPFRLEIRASPSLAGIAVLSLRVTTDAKWSASISGPDMPPGVSLTVSPAPPQQIDGDGAARISIAWLAGLPVGAYRVSVLLTAEGGEEQRVPLILEVE